MIHKTGKLLVAWIDDQTQKEILLLSLLIIQAKVYSILNTLNKLEGSSEAFNASYGWFQRFCWRFNNHCVSGQVARADEETVETSVDLIVLDTLEHLKKEAAEEE